MMKFVVLHIFIKFAKIIYLIKFERLVMGNEIKNLETSLTINPRSSITQNKQQRLQLNQTDICNLYRLSEKSIQTLKLKKSFQDNLIKDIHLLPYKLINHQLYIGQLSVLNQPHGVGKIFKSNGNIFIGNFEKGLLQGQGLYVLNDGSYYQGYFKGSQINGLGKYVFGYYEYEGLYQNGRFHGKGKQTYNDPNDVKNSYTFEGEFQMNKRTHGKLIWKDINGKQYSYQGRFNDEQEFHGRATFINEKGKYVGGFKNGDKNGQGQFQYTDGLIYDGSYENGIRNGQGTLYSPPAPQNINKNRKIKQNISFLGTFANGLPSGAGKGYDQAIGKLIDNKLQTFSSGNQ